MLRSSKQFYGKKLGSSDGEIGHIKDLYFDDVSWAVRYVVVDTGDWLPGRQVLLSPHAFGNFWPEGDSLLVNLTREKIEASPSREAHLPVSRQFEEEYYRYYGWPSYWTGSGMWGAADFSLAPPPFAMPEASSDRHPAKATDPHLRSTKALSGYSLQTAEGKSGRVADFMIDDLTWGIRHVLVEVGSWFSSKEIAISPHAIQQISYEESKIFVSLSEHAVLNAAEYRMPLETDRGLANIRD